MAEAPAVLPPNWASFVEQVTLGASPTAAAEAMNWENPRLVGAALLRHPKVRKALAVAAEARLEGVSRLLALDTVDEILADKDAPKAVRAKLALGVLDRTRPKGETGPQGVKALGDMSVREIEQLVAQLSESGLRPGQMRDVTPGSEAPDDDIP